MDNLKEYLKTHHSDSWEKVNTACHFQGNETKIAREAMPILLQAFVDGNIDGDYTFMSDYLLCPQCYPYGLLRWQP